MRVLICHKIKHREFRNMIKVGILFTLSPCQVEVLCLPTSYALIAPVSCIPTICMYLTYPTLLLSRPGILYLPKDV